MATARWAWGDIRGPFHRLLAYHLQLKIPLQHETFCFAKNHHKNRRWWNRSERGEWKTSIRRHNNDVHFSRALRFLPTIAHRGDSNSIEEHENHSAENVNNCFKQNSSSERCKKSTRTKRAGSTDHWSIRWNIRCGASHKNLLFGIKIFTIIFMMFWIEFIRMLPKRRGTCNKFVLLSFSISGGSSSWA